MVFSSGCLKLKQVEKCTCADPFSLGCPIHSLHDTNSSNREKTYNNDRQAQSYGDQQKDNDNDDDCNEEEPTGTQLHFKSLETSFCNCQVSFLFAGSPVILQIQQGPQFRERLNTFDKSDEFDLFLENLITYNPMNQIFFITELSVLLVFSIIRLMSYRT